MNDYKDGDCQMGLQDIYDCLNSTIKLCLCNNKVDVDTKKSSKDDKICTSRTPRNFIEKDLLAVKECPQEKHLSVLDDRSHASWLLYKEPITQAVE